MRSSLTIAVPLTVVVFDKERTDAEALASRLRAIHFTFQLEVTPIWHATDLGPTLAHGIDLLFMRLDSAQRWDGVDLVRALVPKDSQTRVIYVGGGHEARRRVYLTDHVWHLLEPCSRIELAEAMERAAEVIDLNRERAIALRTGHGDIVVNPRDVTYVESNLRVLGVHEHNRVVETYGSLAAISSLLPHRFVRCHKSYLVNLEHVIGMDERTLRLDSGENVPVSQRRYAATREALYEHFRSLRSH